MKIKIWGARGSVPAPGPETMHYGGNTSCVEVTLSDGSTLILDAGTGIRNLGLALPRIERPIHILLTHLHLDHIQGLMFFAPLFRPESEIIVWGPASPEASLRERIGRYISAPLAPVEVRELPSHVSFREAEPLEWNIGVARIQAQAVNHRGPTLGYRIEDDWVSGFGLARRSSTLIHDCQYTDAEYPNHLGWGHSPISDALEFGRRVETDKLVLFHHDPLHTDDFLDSLSGDITARWQELGRDPTDVELATERRELEISPQPAIVGA
jgi:phosphoribosyl 1,2-cyclic phosphodiesterase